MPTIPTLQELERARSAAREAQEEADALRVMADKAKRYADARTKHYHDMLDIAYGQTELSFDEKESP